MELLNDAILVLGLLAGIAASMAIAAVCAVWLVKLVSPRS